MICASRFEVLCSVWVLCAHAFSSELCSCWREKTPILRFQTPISKLWFLLALWLKNVKMPRYGQLCSAMYFYIVGHSAIAYPPWCIVRIMSYLVLWNAMECPIWNQDLLMRPTFKGFSPCSQRGAQHSQGPRDALKLDCFLSLSGLHRIQSLHPFCLPLDLADPLVDTYFKPTSLIDCFDKSIPNSLLFLLISPRTGWPTFHFHLIS